MRDQGVRMFARLAAVVMTVTGAVTAAGAAQAEPAEAVVADLLRVQDSGGDWRAALAGELDRLPQWEQARSLGGPLSGEIVAGAVTLPGAMELSGDTTIVARDIVVATGRVRVNSHGHTLRLYPVEALRPGTAAQPSLSAAGGQALREVTIETSAENADGQPGSRGSVGLAGLDGSHGSDGMDGLDGTVFACDGTAGWPGNSGITGGLGGTGGHGGPGGEAGDIVLDIPEGTTTSYHLVARGGAGGPGGDGGPGGVGGDGGDGGTGGDGYPGLECPTPARGGAGGDGGFAGDGGPGGPGGPGGVGGPGGDVSVTYPDGYDPAQITIDNAGGTGGRGGRSGLGGSPGAGGLGGAGGSGEFGEASAGFDRPPGKEGSEGFRGVDGTDGVTGTQSKTLRFCPIGSWVASAVEGNLDRPGPFEQKHFVTPTPTPTGEVQVWATPTVKAQWCADGRGNVTKMQVIATSPNRLISELDGRTAGNTAAVQTSRDGKIAYELHFDFEYEFNIDYAFGPWSFKTGTKCAVAIHLIYTDRAVPRNETINPCDPWRPLGQ